MMGTRRNSSEGLGPLLKIINTRLKENWKEVYQEIGTVATRQRLQAFFNNASVWENNL